MRNDLRYPRTIELQISTCAATCTTRLTVDHLQDLPKDTQHARRAHRYYVGFCTKHACCCPQYTQCPQHAMPTRGSKPSEPQRCAACCVGGVAGLRVCVASRNVVALWFQSAQNTHAGKSRAPTIITLPECVAITVWGLMED